ncbi:MAG: quinolinate synthase NadA [Fusobacteria bacterium]|nr:quinolinate synthase NadA [Fusobacteriota bacterium]
MTDTLQENMKLLKNQINTLKKEKNITLVCHNYVSSEIIDIADFKGDSLTLASIASKIESEKILFVGVDFMAETLKILNPTKRIFVPNILATCPMANSLSPEMIQEAKKQYPSTPVVLYVNSTAECKAEADYVCTSGNALEVINNIPSDTIIFGPDKNLGQHIEKLSGKKMIYVPGESGFCYVHDKIPGSLVDEVRVVHPNAKVIVHPECALEVREKADFIGSTGQMAGIIAKDGGECYIIGTEVGMLYNLKEAHPNVTLYALSPHAMCSNMKKNNLLNILATLKSESNEIIVEESLRLKAKTCIVNMFEMMRS